MRLAIIYKDTDIFVEYTPQEFEAELTKLLTTHTLHEALRVMIAKLKKQTLTK